MKKEYSSPEVTVTNVQVQMLIAASISTGIHTDEEVDASDAYSLFDEPMWE
ncbi:MAG: hypothetical protein J6B92_01045 [Paraprevotella sp.]|jgi:hypothetical protein|nr:hypothetical protein [Paraprevotella sp.]MBP3471568.1 hypothetical protein [Paraprevotella sp.]